MGSEVAGVVVLDAGALIQFDRGKAEIRSVIELILARTGTLCIPAGALSQAWRSRSRQVRLGALVRHAASVVLPLNEERAKAAGELCARASTSDTIDASVVLAAREYHAIIYTTGPDDLARLDPTIELRIL